MKFKELKTIAINNVMQKIGIRKMGSGMLESSPSLPLAMCHPWTINQQPL